MTDFRYVDADILDQLAASAGSSRDGVSAALGRAEGRVGGAPRRGWDAGQWEEIRNVLRNESAVLDTDAASLRRRASDTRLRAEGARTGNWGPPASRPSAAPAAETATQKPGFWDSARSLLKNASDGAGQAISALEKRAWLLIAEINASLAAVVALLRPGERFYLETAFGVTVSAIEVHGLRTTKFWKDADGKLHVELSEEFTGEAVAHSPGAKGGFKIGDLRGKFQAGAEAGGGAAVRRVREFVFDDTPEGRALMAALLAGSADAKGDFRNVVDFFAREHLVADDFFIGNTGHAEAELDAIIKVAGVSAEGTIGSGAGYGAADGGQREQYTYLEGNIELKSSVIGVAAETSLTANVKDVVVPATGEQFTRITVDISSQLGAMDEATLKETLGKLKLTGVTVGAGAYEGLRIEIEVPQGSADLARSLAADPLGTLERLNGSADIKVIAISGEKFEAGAEGKVSAAPGLSIGLEGEVEAGRERETVIYEHQVLPGDDIHHVA